MPSSRKKTKHFLARFTLRRTKKRKGSATRQDLIGSFLLIILTSTVTALVSLALTHQVEWPIVAFVFVASLLTLAMYQSRQ